MKHSLLVVDDDMTIAQTLKKLFSERGFDVTTVYDIASAELLLTKKGKVPDVCLLDVQLPDGNGIDLLEKIGSKVKHTAIVMMTAHGGISQSVEAMKRGAADYILKPFNIDEIVLRVERALDRRELKEQLEFTADKNFKEWNENCIVGKNATMQKLHEGLGRIAESQNTTVFIHGETGTGKEVIARQIHRLSPRAKKPFVDINATALTSELLESELFGHEAGSFTGATKAKKGLFEVASGGTLFLDEIGDMAFSMQSKLLRALQERKIRRVGGTEAIEVDIRLITATHQDLRKLVREGTFREDLYYRLNVVPIVLPALRERKEDIELFARFFLKKFSQELKRNVTDIDADALKLLRGYDWPGNIRELKNLLERTVLLECDGPILQAKHLRLGEGKIVVEKTDVSALGGVIPLETIERLHISGVLRATGGNKNQAAKILGIDRTTLYNKIRKYEISG